MQIVLEIIKVITNFQLGQWGVDLKITTLGKALFLFASCLSGSSYAQVVSGSKYRIVSACASNKVMTIAGSSVTDGALAVLATRNDTLLSQVFKIESVSGGYKFTAQHSSKVLDVAGFSASIGTPIQQWTWSNGRNQIFKIQNAPNGFYKLQSLSSGLYVDLTGANTSDGTSFQQYSAKKTCAQRFKLVQVVNPAPTPVPAPAPAPAPAPSPQPSATRDPLKQPFASTSIWNMPIGSAAVYVPANIPNYEGTTEWTPMPGIDEERIVLRPTAPLISINYSDASWSDRDRCVATGGELAKVPVPSDFTISGEHYSNSSASFLMPDKRTIVQTQPFARCSAGGSGTSLVRFADVDLYGDGRSGAHGATKLSALGGSIRMGELRPGSQGPKHVLKVNVSGKSALYKCTIASDCFRWPAYSADNYAVGFYGTVTNNQNTAMKMGALLAIPKSVDLSSLGLQTEPAKQLAWTLQN